MMVVICIIAMYIIALGIGVFNFLCPMWVNIPEFISLIISVIIVGLSVYLLKINKKIYVKILVSALSVLAIIVVNFSTYCNPYWNSIVFKNPDKFKTKHRLEVVSYEDAKEDVDYSMKYLKKVHPTLIKKVPKEIEQEYDKVIDELKSNGRINVETVRNAITSLYSKMEDEHTYVLNSDEIRTAKTYRDNNDGSFVNYYIDEVNGLAILTLDSCVINKQYIDCVNNMFKEVKEQNIQNVVVDLRNNTGGNSGVVNEFIRYVDIDSYKNPIVKQRFGWFSIPVCSRYGKNDKYEELLFDGKIYLLTSNITFSSAMTFTDIIQANKIGIIVGESPGNAPNCYTDTAMFLTPNTRTEIMISTKRQYAIDKNKKEGLIQPDIECNQEEALDKVKEILAR